MKYEHLSVESLSGTENAYEVIEEAARECYQSKHKIGPGTAEKFCAMLLKNGHTAMFDHAYQSFRFVVNRGVTHEMVRHRLAAYAQESTRYCNYSKGKFGGEITLIKQECYDFTDEQTKRREDLFKHIEEVYTAETNEHIPAQIARDLLPICTKSSIVMTCNFTEWRHVLRLRTSKAAHPQIRVVMDQVFAWFLQRYPLCFNDLIRETE